MDAYNDPAQVEGCSARPCDPHSGMGDGMSYTRWALLCSAVAVGSAFTGGPPHPGFLEPPFRCVRVIRDAHKEDPGSLAFSKEGNLLLSTGDGGGSIWDVAAGRPIAFRKFEDTSVSMGTFASNGEAAATGGAKRSIHLMDAHTLKVRLVIPPPDKHSSFSAPVAPRTGTRLFARSSKHFGCWDIRTGKPLWLSAPARGYPTLLAPSPSGDLLAASMREPERVCLLDPATGKEARALEITETASQPQVSALACSDGGLTAAALSSEGRILFWSRAGRPVGEARWLGRVVTGEVFDEDERRRLKPREERDSFAYRIAFSPDGKTLAALCTDGAVRLFECEGGGVRAVWGCLGAAVAFSPDGRLLAALGYRRPDIHLYDWRHASGSALSLRKVDRSRWWDMLASRDAAVGFRAVIEMAADPDEALAVLGRRVAAAAPEATRSTTLVAGLDDDNFETRRMSEKELGDLGVRAEAALRAALARPASLDLRTTLTRLLAPILLRPSEHLRGLRAVEVLEHIGTPQARRLLDRLADGEPGATLSVDAELARRRLRLRDR